MRALKVCSCMGRSCFHAGSCPQLTASGRCEGCDKHADHKRGTAHQRGYSGKHNDFRTAVLKRDPVCTIDGCTERSTDADHYPLSRRELVRRGMDPNDPAHGRGLCHSHHSRSTATNPSQRGGWNAP